MDIKNKLWVEQYRPKTIDAMVMAPEIKAKFKEMITQGEVPHLLFSGKQGTGKTSLARILISSIDCEALEMNSSLDRGIDAVRTKVTSFAVMLGTKKWRIVLMEEADGLTPDAQQSMRNIMEAYSNRVRFILTCNYVTRIIDPIRSRCQEVEFKDLSRKECMKQLTSIIEAEEVKYDKDTLIRIVDLFYPDIRTMINTMQLSTTKKELRAIREDVSDNLTVLTMIKEKKLPELRTIAYRLDFVDIFRYLFDHIEELGTDPIWQTERRMDIAEFMFRDGFIADREINFMACCLKLVG